MRHYPINSKKAMARIVALSIIADGGLDKTELDALANTHILEHLRMSSEEFDDVMHELCDDMLQTFDGAQHGNVILYDGLVQQILSDIQDPTLQRILLKVMITVVDADDRITEGEAILVDQALAFWGINLWEMVEEPHVRIRGYVKEQVQPQTQNYV